MGQALEAENHVANMPEIRVLPQRIHHNRTNTFNDVKDYAPISSKNMQLASLAHHPGDVKSPSKGQFHGEQPATQRKPRIDY